MTDEIRYLGDIQRLQPKPGDVFVLTLPKGPPLPASVLTRIKQQLDAELPGLKVMVLEHGMTVSVANPNEAAT